MNKHVLGVALSAAVMFGVSAAPARAASHLWVVNEIFSNADGTIQFLEMRNPTSAANETALAGKWVRSVQSSEQFNFTQNLPPNSTAFKFLLLATQGFADLRGAPTPDYIMPDNFLLLNGDTLKYWNYITGDMTYGPGALPTDGVLSLDRDGNTATNSPTNFAGQSGSVNASSGIPTMSEVGLMIMAAVLIGGACIVISRRRRPAV